MKLNYLIFCNAAEIDGSNKLNLQGVFDRIASHVYPTALAPATIIFEMVDVKESKLNIKLKLKNKVSQKETLSVEAEREFEVNETGRYRVILNIKTLIFPETGLYIVELKINDKDIEIPNYIEAVKV